MKKEQTMTIRFVSILLFLLILNMPMLVPAQESVSEAQQARADAERDAGQIVSSLAWGFGGFAFNVFGVAYAYFATPGIPAGALLGKTPTYTETYTQVYRYHAKRRRLQAAAIGFGVLVAIGILAKTFRRRTSP